MESDRHFQKHDQILLKTKIATVSLFGALAFSHVWRLFGGFCRCYWRRLQSDEKSEQNWGRTQTRWRFTMQINFVCFQQLKRVFMDCNLHFHNISWTSSRVKKNKKKISRESDTAKLFAREARITPAGKTSKHYFHISTTETDPYFSCGQWCHLH